MPLPASGRRTIRRYDDDDEETAEFAALAARFRPSLTAYLETYDQRADIDPERIAIYDGDLHLDCFDTFDEHLSILVVDGDLTVDGYFGDSEYPESFILVTGALRARDLLVSGWLEVLGPTTITRALFGSGNHCLTWFGGDVSCDLFYPENHAFEFAGGFTPRGLFGQRADRSSPAFLTGTRIHDWLAPALVRTYDDEGPELVDYGELKQRIRTDQPLR